MKLFLDANIIISVLNKEYPLFTYTSRILSLAEKRRFKVFTSPLCLAIAYYFAEKKSGAKLAKQKIDLLVQHISITTVDHNIVEQSLGNSKVKDFEDGLEYYSAIAAKCDFIITEDVKDFYFSNIEVLNCEQYFIRINNK